MKKILAASIVLALVIAVFMFVTERDGPQDGEVAQIGSVEISDGLSYTHEVLYPEPFHILPRVKIKLTTGSGYLEIIEQRADGFVFKSSNLGYSVAEGAHVDWTAFGIVAN